MKAADSAQKAHRWRGWRGRRSKKTDETHFKLSKCGEEFSGLKKDIGGKSFAHHGRIFIPGCGPKKQVSGNIVWKLGGFTNIDIKCNHSVGLFKTFFVWLYEKHLV